MWKPTDQKTYWYPQPTSDELYHHGILGMKWGKRNGPPYPLGSEDHSTAEKKAGWRKSLGGGKTSSVKRKEQKALVKNIRKSVDKNMPVSNNATYAMKIIRDTVPPKKLKTVRDSYKDYQDKYGTDEAQKAWSKYEKARKDLVSDLVGEYGNKSIKIFGGKKTINEIVDYAIHDLRQESISSKYRIQTQNNHTQEIEKAMVIKDPQERINTLVKDCYPPSVARSDKDMYDRAINAAKLGNRAINIIRGEGYVQEPDSKTDIEWFLYEDQTLGLPTAADMINRGYSAEQIDKITQKIKDDYADSGYSLELPAAAWELQEGDWNGSIRKFSEACEQVKKSKS